MVDTNGFDYNKKISYSNFEYISLFVITILISLITNIPKDIVDIAGEAGIISIIVLCIISFFAYFYIIKNVFKKNDNLFTLINKTYPSVICKVIGVIMFIFCLMLVYLIIMNMITTLKTSIYRLSSTSQISIFFLVGMYFLANKGFTNIFRIAGYTSVFACIYLAIVMVFDMAQFNINNIFPILGNGAKNVFLVNLQNICIFTPIFFILLFNNNMDDKKNIGEKNNLNNFYKIISISSFFVITLISVIILTFPPELITNRYSIITDINKIISYTATALQSTPILIFIYSFISFISASFFVLTSTYILEKLNVIKNHKKVVNINILLIGIALYFSDSFALKNIMDITFKYSSIAIVFIFPILTILFNKIKEKIHA